VTEPPDRKGSFVHSHHPARRQALDILYQADVRGEDPAAALQDWTADGREVPGFTREIVEGVTEHRAEIDEILGRHATGWTVHRMAVVDRTILRVACYELLFRPDVPAAAAINEAVEAAKELSTEDSGRFVNGILGRIASEEVGDRPAGP
jgi:N utilization substance protein B